jgi:hypothetical protein
VPFACAFFVYVYSITNLSIRIKKMATQDQTSPEGTIPVSEAMKMTSTWRLYLNNNTTDTDFQVRSYLIPIISFQNLLKYNPDAEAVRAYIGLNELEDVSTTELLLVPIVGGKEMPYRQILDGGGLGDPDCDTDDCSNIYDLSAPCPPECPAPGGPPGGGLDG